MQLRIVQRSLSLFLSTQLENTLRKKLEISLETFGKKCFSNSVKALNLRITVERIRQSHTQGRRDAADLRTTPQSKSRPAAPV